MAGGSGAARADCWVVGLDLGHPNLPAAERWLNEIIEDLNPCGQLVACTHVVTMPFQHVAVSLSLPAPEALPPPPRAAVVVVAPEQRPAVVSPGGPAQLVAAATQAALEHAHQEAGRAVIYPGVERLTGVMRVHELLATSAIERVAVSDGPPPGSTQPRADAVVETRCHVRPHWSQGILTLLVRNIRNGYLVPFEAPECFDEW